LPSTTKFGSGIARPAVVQRDFEDLDACAEQVARFGRVFRADSHAQGLELGNGLGNLYIVALGRRHVRPDLGAAGPHHPTALVRRIFGRHPVAQRFRADRKAGGIMASHGIVGPELSRSEDRTRVTVVKTLNAYPFNRNCPEILIEACPPSSRIGLQAAVQRQRCSRAAKALHITQTAISRQIRVLRQHSGQPRLRGTGRRID
jgi:hypothetical protein